MNQAEQKAFDAMREALKQIALPLQEDHKTAAFREALREIARRALTAAKAVGPAHQWLELTYVETANCCTKIKPYPIDLVQVPAEQIESFAQAISDALREKNGGV